jgi:hypothetical protein
VLVVSRQKSLFYCNKSSVYGNLLCDPTREKRLLSGSAQVFLYFNILTILKEVVVEEGGTEVTEVIVYSLALLVWEC